MLCKFTKCNISSLYVYNLTLTEFMYLVTSKILFGFCVYNLKNWRQYFTNTHIDTLFLS